MDIATQDGLTMSGSGTAREMDRWEILNRVTSRYECVGSITRMLANLPEDYRAAVLADVSLALAQLDAEAMREA